LQQQFSASVGKSFALVVFRFGKAEAEVKSVAAKVASSSATNIHGIICRISSIINLIIVTSFSTIFVIVYLL